MNHVYRTVFNRALGVWQVAAEITTSHGKGRSKGAGKSSPGHGKGGGLRMLILFPLSLWAAGAWSTDLPTGGTVSAGSGSISQHGAGMTIAQQSQNLAINWQSFDIGKEASVTFVQPNASAIALNRVLGTSGTQILGQLKGNGQVWVLNPNGVLFGRSAQVSVGGLVASTLGLSDADFLAGKRRFSGNGGTVSNQGRIDAGYVALLGEQVKNGGVIVARLGTAALAAGNKVTLDFAGDRLLNVQVDEGALHALADNQGLIQADGGAVLMTARAKDALLDTAVNNSGVINARTIENRDGHILLLGDMDSGTVHLDGTLDASAPDGGEGGFIETSAAHVKVADSARITTKASEGNSGTWLIDPVDFTIAASGGDMTGQAVSNALAGNNFTIQSTQGDSGTAGDINVDDAVSWNKNTLTLQAQHDIHLNAPMNGSGTAGLALQYGLATSNGGDANYYVNAPVNLASTGSFSTRLGSDGAVTNYTIITRLGAAGSATGTDLQGMEGNWSGNYVLGADIDASATTGWNGGAGFMPIAQENLWNLGHSFSGHFDGLGHVIDGLTVHRPSSSNVGLFGVAEGATIANVGLTHVSILGNAYVGGLAGGAVDSTVSNSYSTGAVIGTGDVGGLLGADFYPRPNTVLRNVYSTADVTDRTTNSDGGVGGLVGRGGIIQNSYATGTITGSGFVGGLVGRSDWARVSNSYFAGTLAVDGTPMAVGAIIGGAVLQHENTLTHVYWSTDTVGTSLGSTGNNAAATETNVAGLTTAQMRDAANWAGFDFTATPGGNGWVLVGDDGGLNGSHGTVLPMLASEWSSVVRNAHQLQLMELDKSASYVLADDIDASATDGSSSAGAHDVWLGSSFAPIGRGVRFTGNFDGMGHKIDQLTINRPGTDFVGLFGTASSSRFANVGLTNVNIIGRAYVGGLLGYGFNSVIENAYAEGGTVSGDLLTTAGSSVGGLAGGFSGKIDHSHATADVSGNNYVGGLVGQLGGFLGGFDNTDSFISYLDNSYATGDVNAVRSTGGGLAGQTKAYLSNVYATGNVIGGNGRTTYSYLGGLIGLMLSPILDDRNGGVLVGAYATGNVTATESTSTGKYVGGLVGLVQCSCSVTDVFATGNVKGLVNVGGLFGGASGFPLMIVNAYAKDGTVTGAYSVGGLIGEVQHSVWLWNAWAANGALASTDADTRAGGLVGSKNLVESSTSMDIGGVWNKETSGAEYMWGVDRFTVNPDNSTQGAATTAQMMQKAVYEDPYYGNFFNGALVTDDWATAPYDPAGNPVVNGFRLYEGKTYPLLRFFLTPLVVSATPDYDGSGAAMGNIGSATFTNAPSGAHIFGTGSVIQGSTLTLGSTQDGSYTVTTDGRVTGLYTDSQFGYDFITGPGVRTISTPGSVAGDIQLPASVNWISGTLIIDTSGAITTVGANGANTTAIHGTSFRLDDGTWNQNSSTLAGFSVDDFRLGNGNFLRAIGGNGDEDDPYRLTDLYGLQGMASAAYLGSSFALANDIAAADTAGWNGGAGFVPVGNGTTAFTGNFDGAGHTISDLSISRSGTNYVGLFGQAVGGSLGNVILDNASVQGSEQVGMFAGRIGRDTEINNVQAHGTVSAGSIGGGLVGSSNGRITGSRASGTVTVIRDHAGGLVAWSDGTGISGSSADVTVRGKTYVGGLAGEVDDAVEDSYATGDVLATGNVGNFDYLDSYAGGLIGYAGASAPVSNSYATGTVTASYGSKVGGLIGETHAAINDSYATGAVSGYAYVGGLVGATSALIADSHATGAVLGGPQAQNTAGLLDVLGLYPDAGPCISAGSGCVGGLAGSSSADISNSYATGNVTGTATGTDTSTTSDDVRPSPDTQQIGGLVGRQEGGTISNSFASGDVKGRFYAGGLVGWANGTIVNTYATGDVTSSGFYSIGRLDGYTGGLVGYLDSGAVNTSYATGTVANVSALAPDTPSLGGLMGEVGVDGSVSNSFYATTDADGNAINTGLPSDGIGTRKTLAELRQAATFAGWDLSASGGSDAVWRIYEGYTSPLLRSFMTSVTVSADLANAGKTYDGSIASGTVDGYTTSVPVAPSLLLGSLGYSTTGADAGTYTTADGNLHVDGSLYSGQFGYDIDYSLDTALTIAKANATVTGNSGNVTYNGQTQSVSGYTVSGLVNGENADVLDSLAESGGSGRNAGSYAHAVSGSDNNYNLTFVDGSLAIAKASLVFSTGDVTRTYDGTTAANGTLVSTGLVGGDSVSGGSFAYTDRNAGTGKTVTVSGVTVDDGNNGDNYNVSYVDNTGSTIGKAGLYVGTANVVKTYDGTTTAAGTTQVILGTLYGSDALSGGSFAYTDKNAGMGKTVTVSGVTVNDGNNGDNYSIVYALNTNSTIDKANLVVGSTDVVKTYDGTTTAAGAATAVDGTELFGTDTLSGGSFAFTDKNAGMGKTVTVGGVTVNDGNDGDNYNVTYADNASSTIDRKALTISGTVAAGKTYDGSTTAGIIAGTLDGMVGDETLDVSAAGEFDSANAGDRAATASYTLGDGGNGGLASNYSLDDTTGLAATIERKALTIGGSTAAGKTYDGTSVASIDTGTLSGLVGSETLGITATGTFDSANAGSRSATASYTLGDGSHGGLASNYSLADTTGLAATIGKAGITVSTGDVTKTYDGTTAAAGSAVVTGGMLFGDDEISGGSIAFTDRNAGTNKTVTVSGVTIDDGNNGDNYAIDYADNVTSTIDRKALTISGTVAAGKTYDGTTSASIGAGTLAGLVGNETLDVAATGEFDSANAGTRTATASYALGDGDHGGLASNYTLDDTTGLIATIDRKTLAISGSIANDKTYDGSTSAGITAGTLDGLVGDETLDIAATGEFDSANAGDRIATASYTLCDGSHGGLASNYTLDDTTGLIVTIDRRALTISGTVAAGKTYDGSTNAGITAGTLAGLVGSETLDVSATGEFDSANAGDRTAIASYTLGDGSHGGLASNYVLADTTGLAATIDRKALAISGSTANGKTYDGSAAASITAGTLTGLVGNETLGVAATGQFDNANAGARIATASYTLGDGSHGGLGSNYILDDTTGLAATIDRKALAISGTVAAGKTYDGSTDASITAGTLAGLVGNETLDVSATGEFDSANAGTRTATASYTLGDGSHGGRASNYTLDDTTGLAAMIDRKALTISGSTANGKTYDGSAAASITAGTLGGLVGNDTLDVSAIGQFDSANAGARIATASYTLSDGRGLAANYSLADATGLAATINKAGITVSTGGVTKVYDGTTVAAGTAQVISGTLFGDDGLSGGSFAFADRNAGTGKTVTVDGVTVNDGNSGGNYDVTYADNTGSTIDKASLTVSTGDITKVYDGTTAAAGTARVISGTLFGDDGLSGGSFAFADRKAGTGKVVTVDGVTVNDGNSGGNYDVTYADNTGSAIDRASLAITGSFDAADKIRDGQTGANISRNGLGLDGVIAGDSVAADWNAAFADAAAGTAKTVTLDGTTLEGGDGQNYVIDLAGAPTATADILASPGVPGDAYAGAVNSVDAGGNTDGTTVASLSIRTAGTSIPGLPNFTVLQCGQNLPAPLTKDCP